MNKVISGILFLLLLAFFMLPGQQQKNVPDYKKLYDTANDFYNSTNPTDITDSLALRYYQQVIAVLSRQPLNENLLVDCYIKTGILYQAKNIDSLAIQNFGNAIHAKTAAQSDSLLYQPFLYTGSSYYSLNNLDSALFFLKKAEEIVTRYSNMPEAGRVYNKIGALYYQTGNYKQSINYFKKSIDLLYVNDPGYTEFLVQYKTNLGAVYFKLKEYKQAMDIYNGLLALRTPNPTAILHNIGSIFLETGDDNKALQYLRPLPYNLQLKLNDMARIYINLKKDDSAKLYLDSGLAENKKQNGVHKNITQGLLLKYYGDFSIRHNDIEQALLFYQQSIIQLDPDFFEENIYKNPTQFNGLHSSFNLFAALTQKAAAFNLLYKKNGQFQNLTASLQTYKAAFNLAHYVERFLDTDEARLFLQQNVEEAYSNAIETAVALYELTGDEQYTAEAFVLSESSKATVLQVNREQLQIEQINGMPQQLVHEERNCKANIARLTLQAVNASDSTVLENIQRQISNYEIQLSKIQEKLNDNQQYNRLRYQYDTVSVKKIKDELLTKKTALLSYYFTKEHLITFVINADSIVYRKMPITSALIANIKSSRAALESETAYDRERASTINKYLFLQLVQPVYAAIQNYKRLIIIAHNELHYIPFEILENPESGNYLIQDYAISYNYAASFITNTEATSGDKQVLAVAPFTTAIPQSRNSIAATFAVLPASLEEVKDLKGKILTDTSATKDNFIKYAPHYGIIHLATHATATDGNPAESFISFYPKANSPDLAYKLYEPEIYNLNLSNSSLVILSACETGKGKLISGEGVMSLSRAFSYAGCPSIITSLWKAEDHATAFITQQLHGYLQQGYSKDVALQKAKLAYLANEKIEPGFKTPNFWAHLVLTGNTIAITQAPTKWWPWSLFVLLSIIAVLFFIRKKNKEKQFR